MYFLLSCVRNKTVASDLRKGEKHAGAELGQAQVKQEALDKVVVEVSG